jgi:hypothetical protein
LRHLDEVAYAIGVGLSQFSDEAFHETVRPRDSGGDAIRVTPVAAAACMPADGKKPMNDGSGDR